MNTENKTKILVLYGGKSTEHEISLQSAKFIMQQIDKDLFDVVPVLIDKNNRWLLQRPDVVEVKARSRELVAASDSKLIVNFDVVFPIIHGYLGEDGALQGLLEMLDVPYVGPNVLSAAMAMDKDVAKRLVSSAGIFVAPYFVVRIGQWQKNSNDILAKIELPVFIKPANTGSSVGITKVTKKEDVKSAIDLAFNFDTKVLVEKAIKGREIELAALGNCYSADEIIISVPGEIVPRHEFYSYDAKYLDKAGADLIVPADLTKEQIGQLQQHALTIFRALECIGMARIDFFLEAETKRFCFNELNTVPGFTGISMYPKTLEASGVSSSTLITKLIQLAKDNYQLKQQLQREL